VAEALTPGTRAERGHGQSERETASEDAYKELRKLVLLGVVIEDRSSIVEDIDGGRVLHVEVLGSNFWLLDRFCDLGQSILQVSEVGGQVTLLLWW
jgi:hypothetical protein